MPIFTPMIQYSLKDRGRKHTGQARNFNTKLICDAINSPACQEMVSSRGMVGYYGHFPRVRFGMMPSEGGMDGGKYVPVDPAFVTTHLSATPEGIIRHQAEFLDTAAGLVAAKAWNGRVRWGGFGTGSHTPKRDRQPAKPDAVRIPMGWVRHRVPHAEAGPAAGEAGCGSNPDWVGSARHFEPALATHASQGSMVEWDRPRRASQPDASSSGGCPHVLRPRRWSLCRAEVGLATGIARRSSNPVGVGHHLISNL